MCTASHNPKAYTGVKLVARGRARAVRRLGHRRHPRAGRATGSAPPPRRRPRPRTVDVYADFQDAALRVHRRRRRSAAQRRARRRQRHGRADGRAAPRARCRSSWSRPDWEPTATFPEPRAQPAAARRTAATSSTRCATSGADIGIAWDGDADRCFFIDGTGEFVAGDFLTALLAEALLLKHPGADDPLRRARLAARSRTRSTRLGGRALVNRVGHAFFKTRMRESGAEFGGEVSGHYYFRDFYNADSGSIPALLILELLSQSGERLSELLRAVPRALLHLRRDQHRGRRPAGQDATSSSARYADAQLGPTLDGMSVDYDGLALQRAPVEHRAAAAPDLESLVSRADMERRRDEVLALIRGDAASTACRSRRRSWSGASTAT